MNGNRIKDATRERGSNRALNKKKQQWPRNCRVAIPKKKRSVFLNILFGIIFFLIFFSFLLFENKKRARCRSINGVVADAGAPGGGSKNQKKWKQKNFPIKENQIKSNEKEGRNPSSFIPLQFKQRLTTGFYRVFFSTLSIKKHAI